MTLKEKLQKIAAGSNSDWLEEAGKSIANRGARTNARKVALRVLHTLRQQNISQTDLAERMGVSRQQVNKIVKGKENFTFETIDKLEKALNITLMTIDAPGKPISAAKTTISAMVTVPVNYSTMHIVPVLYVHSFDGSHSLPDLFRPPFKRTVDRLMQFVGHFPIAYPLQSFPVVVAGPHGIYAASPDPAEEWETFQVMPTRTADYSTS